LRGKVDQPFATRGDLSVSRLFALSTSESATIHDQGDFGVPDYRVIVREPVCVA
jgi:hypothetical protein